MIVIRIAAMLMIAALVASCAQRYAVTGSGPTAKLRYTTNTGDNTVLLRYDIASCPATPQPQRVAWTVDSMVIPGEASPIQMIGTSGAIETKIREMLIDAGTPFVFSINATGGGGQYVRGYTCTVYGGFSPADGNEYEMDFQVGTEGCRSRIYRLSMGSNGQVVRKPEATQRYMLAAQDQDFCQWRSSKNEMPDEIREALERPESTQSSTTAPAKTGSGGKPAEPTSDELGSEIRDALKAPKAP